jgi:ATPase subunit of ABC transporter with duplicated ATPase domains
MNTLLSAHSLRFDTPQGPLFTDITFTLRQGDRIGLTGYNGCGKSTLLRLLAGTLAATQGEVTRSGRCLLAVTEQHLSPAIARLSLCEAVAEKLPAEQRVSERWQVERLLEQLGFASTGWDQAVSTLSGGQHTRLMLARALIMQPDLLLLDEPGNHLDLPTLLWLEGFLQQWCGSFIMVSHDRPLLDNVTNCSWILRDGTLQVVRLPCSQALAELALSDESDRLRRQSEQKEIDRLEKSAKRLAVWGQVYDNEKLARKAKQMEKQTERLRDDQTILSAGTPWTLRLNGEKLIADRLLEFSGLQVRPAPEAPALYVLDNLRVKSGDRIAILGANGSGKSSLLKTLWQSWLQLPVGVVFHPRLTIGYYDQQLHQLNDDDSLTDALLPFAPLTDDQRKMALIAAGFTWPRHQQQVGSLSGGERSRLLFVGLSLARYALLMLDEPTNHLDMDGKQQLAETLCQFEGAVLLVSHDRELIAASCNRFWWVADGQISEWHDVGALYTAMSAALPEQQDSALKVKEAPTVSHEDDLLEKLVALEQQLAAELMRKPRHQKPALQARLHQEIAGLTAALALG